MKKSLVLAMAMALGVTASAYAANPFSDVPAGHWAYDSISKLAAAGVIEGYGDDTFRGDRLMTRYEMAQIVAKAMAKGANVDKLAAEFADELDALGVRVAALEKKADNVKITGQIRWNYESHKRSNVPAGKWEKRSRNRLRSRLIFNGTVNDNWTYTGRLENTQVFHGWSNNEAGLDPSNVGEDGETKFNQAFVKGRLGGVKITAGRYSEWLGDGNIFDDKFDGIRIGYGKKIRFGAYYGKPTGHQDSSYGGADLTKAFGANLGFDLGKKATLDLAYDRFESDGNNGTTAKADEKFGIFSANLYGKFTKNFGLGVMYMHSHGDNTDYIAEDASKSGFVVTANVAGASYEKPGSWGFTAKYYHAPAGTAICHTMVGAAPMDFTSEGYKGYSLSADYTIAKNMKYGITWLELKGREKDMKHKVLWNEFQLRF